jgi:hypothetical protein
MSANSPSEAVAPPRLAPTVGPSAGPAPAEASGPSLGPPGPPGGEAETVTDTGGALSTGPGAGPPGSSTSTSGGGVSSGPGSGPPGAPGGGTTAGSSTSTIAETFAGNFADSLLGLIQNATGGEALEAQNIILRRIALEGDVVPSRVPAPSNITEIGGYLNLLSTLNQTDMQSQVLAGILGVAGPNPPLGWLSPATQLSWMTIANDRPEGPAQVSIPVTISVRSDFVAALQQALAGAHSEGCLVPFMGGPTALPAAATNALPPDPLPYIGRVLTLAGGAALTEPATDALALARAQGTAGLFEIAAIARGAGAASIPPASYEVLVGTATSIAPSALTGATLVYLAPAFAAAGFYPASPLPQPKNTQESEWTRLTNVTGLVPGTTKLGDELSLLYPPSTITESVFAGMLGWVWNGSQFAASA